MESEMQKRLAIFLPSFADGGAEKCMLSLAHGLVEKGHAVDLVMVRAEGPNLTAVPKGAHVVDLKAARVLSSLPALVGYLRRERPDAMVSALNFANIIALWARNLSRGPTRIIASEHNTLSVAQRNTSRWRSRMIPPLIRFFYPWADGIIAVSNGVAADLVKVTGVPPASLHVIYNPVVTPELRIKAHLAVDHPWFYPDHPPIIVAVGRLKPQKDFPTLIHAFAKVRQKRPSRLLILGEGPERGALEALVRDLGLEQDVSLEGFVENPYAYMSRASLFVLSSRWEGLPTVLIEALYCGIPIVSTDCPSGPREILADGRYGSLVPVQDVSALAEAIDAGLSGNIPRPSRDSWQPFELEAVLDQYIRLLTG